MGSILVTVAVTIISYYIFIGFFTALKRGTFINIILLPALNKSIFLNIFRGVQKFTGKLKRKNLYSNLALLLLCIICILIQDRYHLGDIAFGIILGFSLSLNDAIFGSPFKSVKSK